MNGLRWDGNGVNVLVIGASGFLGYPLCRRLALHGANVYAASRSINEANVPPGAIPYPLDAAEIGAVCVAIQTLRPHLIYHLTSDSRGERGLELVPDSVRNDIVATTNVLSEAARQATVKRVIMTASLEEPFEAMHPEAIVPVSPYAAAKYTTGLYARLFRTHLDVVRLRLMYSYGPRQKPFKLVPSVITRLLRDEPVEIFSAARLVDFVYLDDVVGAFVAAACPPDLPTTLDVGSGTLVSIGECVSLIALQMGKSHLVRIGNPNRGTEIVRKGDTELAASVLNWRAATPLPEGLKRTIMWFTNREERHAEHLL